jgi:hypothetical protein
VNGTCGLVGDTVNSSGGLSGGLGPVGLLAGGWLLVLADAAEQCGQVAGGELPVERPGGAVVAVHEGQQGIAERTQAGEVAGGEDFLLDDGKDDLVG